MKCPYCSSEEDKVIDSRTGKDGSSVRRRRECLKCGKRYTTHEYIEKIPLTVIKRDGRREPFDRQKLIQGIRIASSKRPVSIDTLEQLIDEVILAIEDLGKKEIESRIIGEKVMKRLKKIDDVTYIRFASVYRSFKDTSEFLEEVQHLLKNR
ncbi:MAG: transcriptional regulator NrdR [bacterium]|nr:transcriptional regulator NrdR [bacterium]